MPDHRPRVEGLAEQGGLAETGAGGQRGETAGGGSAEPPLEVWASDGSHRVCSPGGDGCLLVSPNFASGDPQRRRMVEQSSSGLIGGEKPPDWHRSLGTFLLQHRTHVRYDGSPDRGVSLGIDDLIAAPLLEQRRERVLHLQPGRVVEMIGDLGTGMTRLGLRLLAEHSRVAPVVAVDLRGWISPAAAWETGVVPERLVVVRCPDPSLWPKVTAVLLEGVRALYTEVPTRVKDQDIRRLASLARARRVAVAMRSTGHGLPSGVAHLRLRAIGVTWEGADRGHGRLKRRRLVLEASGKGVSGIPRMIEVEDEGTDALRVVSDVVVDQTRRAVG